jgi:hypothetical protein
VAVNYIPSGSSSGGRVMLRVSDAELAYVQQTLNAIPQGAQKAIRAAINSTLAKARTELARAIRQEVNIPYGEIRDRITIPRKASNTALSGTLRIDYRNIPLIKFKAKYTKKVGVTVHMLKNQSPLTFNRAFIATGPKRGTQVWERQKGAAKREMTTGKYAGRVIKRGPRKGQPFLRQPLRRMPGISAVNVFEILPDLQERALANIGNELAKQIASKIQWQLSRATPNAPDFA